MDWGLLKRHCRVSEGCNPCWEWTGRLTPQGYPTTDRILSKRLFCAKSDVLHVAVAMEHPEWKDGMQARHGCNNRKCISPMHVVPGTASDNMVDRVLDGKQNTAVLTPDKALAIRKEAGTRVELAKKFGCSPSTIKKIKCGYTWKFLVEEDA